ncbi:MAG: 30S ribosomal protein S16 [Betaproteobacteria bacterium]|jgi:small subunit ribosomal protein S16|nr:30S ribosomal protein S16 [Betaproteobacteria bacterium]NBY18397.1 30S ribosomal protein S16 [Betaproteobacteria bacterium]
MVVLRLSRGGAKNRPFYSIVAADKRSRRDGNFIERVGFFNPVASGGEVSLRIAMDRLTYWTSTGAQMSPAVAKLVDRFARQVASQPAAAVVAPAAAPASPAPSAPAAAAAPAEVSAEISAEASAT